MPAGLCGRCGHSRVIRTRKGSVFRFCRKSEQDPGYPRYPPLPVLACRGFEEEGGSGVEDGTHEFPNEEDSE